MPFSDNVIVKAPLFIVHILAYFAALLDSELCSFVPLFPYHQDSLDFCI